MLALLELDLLDLQLQHRCTHVAFSLDIDEVIELDGVHVFTVCECHLFDWVLDCIVSIDSVLFSEYRGFNLLLAIIELHLDC